MQKKDYMIQLLKYFIMAIVVGIIVGAMMPCLEEC